MLLKFSINNVLEYYIKHLITLNTSVERKGKKYMFCFMVIVVDEQKQWSWEKRVVGFFFFFFKSELIQSV